MRFCISISGLVCLSICPIKNQELWVTNEMSVSAVVLSVTNFANCYVTMTMA